MARRGENILHGDTSGIVEDEGWTEVGIAE